MSFFSKYLFPICPMLLSVFFLMFSILRFIMSSTMHSHSPSTSVATSSRSAHLTLYSLIAFLQILRLISQLILFCSLYDGPLYELSEFSILNYNYSNYRSACVLSVNL